MKKCNTQIMKEIKKLQEEKIKLLDITQNIKERPK